MHKYSSKLVFFCILFFFPLHTADLFLWFVNIVVAWYLSFSNSHFSCHSCWWRKLEQPEKTSCTKLLANLWTSGYNRKIERLGLWSNQRQTHPSHNIQVYNLVPPCPLSNHDKSGNSTQCVLFMKSWEYWRWPGWILITEYQTILRCMIHFTKENKVCLLTMICTNFIALRKLQAWANK